jgi:hypothetical protein
MNHDTQNPRNKNVPGYRPILIHSEVKSRLGDFARSFGNEHLLERVVATAMIAHGLEYADQNREYLTRIEALAKNVVSQDMQN